MGYRLTKAQEANCQAGICTRCGVQASYRNTAGHCGDCHNRQWHERKAREKEERLGAMAAGRQYWRERGIEVGERVVCERPSYLPWLPPSVFVGVAKVGRAGAYVHCPAMGAKQLDPGQFDRAGLFEHD